MRIFIDAGHGGQDPGAVANGLRESEIVLDVSRRLAEILRNLRIEVMLSRDIDVSLSVNQRWQMANSWGATHFISVHVNAGGGTGVETIIPTQSPNNSSRNLAENRRFASIMSNTLGSRLGLRVRRDNGVMLESETGHGTLGVLRHTAMLAVLVELAFIDSPAANPDVNILRSRRAEMAQSLAEGLLSFLGMATTTPQQPQQPEPPVMPQTPPPPVMPQEPVVAEWARVAWDWAMQNGLMDGTRPTNNVTRQEIATLLHRFMGLVPTNANTPPPVMPQEPQNPDVAEWARVAWSWAMQNGIMDGTRPTDNVTRQEIATLLHRFKGVIS